jgi:hypothetical protein
VPSRHLTTAPDWATIALVAIAIPVTAATITGIGTAAIQRTRLARLFTLNAD